MRRQLMLVVALAVAVAAALPAISAASPPGDAPSGRAAGKPDRTGKPDTGPKGPGEPVRVSGVVEQRTDGKGRPAFTITADGVTWELSAGPKWFLGDGGPLAAWVGQTVEVEGTHRPASGEAEIDVERLNGEPLREPGRPPWAGGPAKVGEVHPGWKDWKGTAAGRPDGRPGRLDAPGNGGEEAHEAGDAGGD